MKYEYDAHGNLTKVTDRAGQVTTLRYDAADNLSEIDYPSGRFLKFRYNLVGQRTQSLDQAGFTVNYTYDALGRLWKLLDGNSNLIAQYSYDAAGRLIEKDMGNGTYTTYQYDAAGQLLHLVNRGPRPGPGQDGPVNSRFDYTYDALARVARVDNSDGRWDYTYDASGQLTHAVFTSNNPAVLPNQDLQYVYDAAGNRTQTVINGVTTPYTVDARNEYTQVGGTAYTYDADGNLATAMIGAVTTTYTFDQLNELTGISSPGDTWSHVYDAFGNRTGTTHSGQTTQFQIDPAGLGNLVAQFDGTGSLIAHYTHGLGLVSQVPAFGAAGYYDFDLTGNTAGITGTAGTYTNKYVYLPFGEVVASSGSLANPLTFVGQYGVRSDGSGLLHMRNRDYDPATGQFNSNDPLGLGGGDPNIRRYVENNPVSFIDPIGLGWEERARGGTSGSVRLDELFECFKKKPNPKPKPKHKPKHKPQSRPQAHGSPPQHNPSPPSSPPPVYGYPPYKGYPPAPADDFDSFPLDPSDDGDPPNTGPGGGAGCPCGCPPQTPPSTGGTSGPSGSSGTGGSADPNELVGPAGFGPQEFVTPQQTLAYTIKFENDPILATLAAQDVSVTEQLDADLDLSTFELGSIQFGSTTFPVPAGLQSFATSVMTSNIDGTPLRVDITASLDLQTGIVTWVFRSLDPATGLWPQNPIAGFLPVNDATNRGQGFVDYTVRPKATLNTGTEVRAVAQIVFDTNSSIATNQVDPHDPSKGADPAKEALVTIDGGPPTSSVKQMAATNLSTFTVSWSGSDANGSGIASYGIFVSDNSGPFTALLTNTTLISTSFTGQVGHTYRFYSIVTDNVGNRQATSSPLQTTAVVSRPQALVAKLYQDLLQRPADAGGLTYWAGQLVAGASRLQVGLDLANTQEYRERLVEGYFTTHLGRPVDAGGRAHFVGMLNAGSTAEQVQAQILGSNEFFQKRGNGTAGSYLTALFGDVLHRAPTANDEPFFRDLIAQGRRVEVAEMISHSGEYQTELVKGFYQRYLHRQADGGGLGVWLSYLQNGTRDEQVIAGIVGSQEYFSFKQSFVRQVFVELLERPADAGGEGFWNAELARGVSRTQVGLGITATREFREKLVQRYYVSFLGRAADAVGLNQFVSLLAGGATVQRVQAEIFGSDEYFQKRGGSSVSGFVDAIYGDVLHRAPDGGGKAFFTGLLAQPGRTRAQVADLIFASDEYLGVEVQGLYQRHLRRAAESAGLNFWTNALKSGQREEDVIAAILGSDEYFSRL